MHAVKLDPQRPFKRDPVPPDQLRARLTPAGHVFVTCHLGVPRIERADWALAIAGLVEQPRTLQFDDLGRYSKLEVTSIHQCCGNPLAPFEPTRRVTNVTWGGVRLGDVLGDCRPSASARYLWSHGADYGEFSGVATDAYVKDLPLARLGDDVLIAYEMNGEALTAEHGFPVRLVVPGFYGTNSVKWLTRIELAAGRATGPFTTRWYNDPILDGAGKQTDEATPVWSIAPESVIVSPAPKASLAAGVEQEIWGWAWADGGVRHLYVCTDGATWQPAELDRPRGREWQRFSLRWSPSARGAITLAAIAEAMNGQVQPLAGRRNAVHEVIVSVT
jgi:DMSO/TMAO reductase YedYZ molybdopterin-dependent catalytic subunit